MIVKFLNDVMGTMLHQVVRESKHQKVMPSATRNWTMPPEVAFVLAQVATAVAVEKAKRVL